MSEAQTMTEALSDTEESVPGKDDEPEPPGEVGDLGWQLAVSRISLFY